MLDRDGAPVSDALLEFWCASGADGNSSESGFPSGFARAAADGDGNFYACMCKPSSITSGDGAVQAPHMLVLVFARGLLRHLITRVYFDGELGNDRDPVLRAVPAERRHTLIAQGDGTDSFCWNVILQGADETVFFAW
jgi:protocatechuate 3,4-dioxygenase alpha subunit